MFDLQTIDSHEYCLLYRVPVQVSHLTVIPCFLKLHVNVGVRSEKMEETSKVLKTIPKPSIPKHESTDTKYTEGRQQKDARVCFGEVHQGSGDWCDEEVEQVNEDVAGEQNMHPRKNDLNESEEHHMEILKCTVSPRNPPEWQAEEDVEEEGNDYVKHDSSSQVPAEVKSLATKAQAKAAACFSS